MKKPKKTTRPTNEEKDGDSLANFLLSIAVGGLVALMLTGLVLVVGLGMLSRGSNKSPKTNA